MATDPKRGAGSFPGHGPSGDGGERPEGEDRARREDLPVREPPKRDATDRARSALERARVALRRRDFETAAAALEAARESGDELGTAEAAGLELELLVEEGRFEDAEILAERLARQYPASARILWLAARVAYKQKRYAQAESWSRESLALFPHDRTRRLLGRTLTQRGSFEEAESILLDVVERVPICHSDLAWLHERRGDVDRAIASLEKVLERRPGDRFATSSLARLRSLVASPAELRDEVESLRELGEEIPLEWIAGYSERLLAAGETEELQRFLEEERERLGDRERINVAWNAYHAGAWSLAVDLFLGLLESQRENVKLRTALEAAARRARRSAEVLAAYRRAAREDPRFLGRVRRLEKAARREAPTDDADGA